MRKIKALKYYTHYIDKNLKSMAFVNWVMDNGLQHNLLTYKGGDFLLNTTPTYLRNELP